MELNPHVRTVFRLLFLAAILVSVAVVSAILTIRFTIHRGEETLPNLVGSPVAHAQQVVNGLHANLKVEDKLFSKTVPAGSIVSQTPAGGTLIRPLQDIHVLVSLGSPQIKVPDVIGRSLRVARIMAVERGLNIGDVAALYWPQGEPNAVLAQDPPPAATDLQTPDVDFLVSLGPAPPAYLCPDFQGKSVAVIQAELQQAGFQNPTITRLAVSGAARGEILSQQPVAGSKVTPDTIFEFQVSE